MLDPPPIGRDEPQPLWFQILSAIGFPISGGILAPGDQLPSKSGHRAHFSLSRTSIWNGLGHLGEYSEGGRGALSSRVLRADPEHSASRATDIRHHSIRVTCPPPRADTAAFRKGDSPYV